MQRVGFGHSGSLRVYCSSNIRKRMWPCSSNSQITKKDILIRCRLCTRELDASGPGVTTVRTGNPKTLHCPTMSLFIYGRSGERRMYGFKQQESYQSHVANEVYVAVRDFQLCERDRRTTKRYHVPHLFSLTRPFEFVAIDVLGLLQKTEPGTQLIVVGN